MTALGWAGQGGGEAKPPLLCFCSYSPKFLVFSSVTKKVTQARKGLGTNSVGLATELSLVSKLLQKVIPKKISAGVGTLQLVECRLVYLSGNESLS